MEREVLENINPHVFEKLPPRLLSKSCDNDYEPVDPREVFDLICTIRDPEHPMTLEELGVVNLKHIEVNDDKSTIKINYTPTIPHCSMATLIGLSIRVKLIQNLAPRFKVNVEITPGTHVSEHAINKQLADKERVAAAMENKHLSGVINQCICFDSPKGLNIFEDIGCVMKEQIFGDTYKFIKKMDERSKDIGKYDFLKSEAELYSNFIFLENVNEEMMIRFQLKDARTEAVLEHHILADLEYLKTC